MKYTFYKDAYVHSSASVKKMNENEMRDEKTHTHTDTKQVTRSNTRSRGSDAKNKFDENENFKLKFKNTGKCFVFLLSLSRASSRFICFALRYIALFHYNFIMHEGDGDGYDDFP